MQKSERQKSIIDLISAKNIGRQEELSELLEKRGFSATQSSISRDLLDLGIVKISGHYALPQRPAGALAIGLLLSLDTAGPYMVVAKCPSGLASAAAVRIDGARIPEITGTIAGDDTIFIAVRDEKAQRQSIKRIWEIFEQ
jgi:transcriptional regulator of arginine metabolism